MLGIWRIRGVLGMLEVLGKLGVSAIQTLILKVFRFPASSGGTSATRKYLHS